MWAILLGRGLGQRSPRVLLCFLKRCIRSGKPQVYEAYERIERVAAPSGPSGDSQGRGSRTVGSSAANVLAGTEEEPDVMGERTLHDRRTTQAGGAR